MSAKTEMAIEARPIVTATHKGKQGGARVRAWRYLPTAPRPLWVFRNFHDLGDGKLTHVSSYVVQEGSWIVNDGAGHATVWSNEEFEKCFEAVEK